MQPMFSADGELYAPFWLGEVLGEWLGSPTIAVVGSGSCRCAHKDRAFPLCSTSGEAGSPATTRHN
jgi:hypothetical protein